jgi:hypothetical protein
LRVEGCGLMGFGEREVRESERASARRGSDASAFWGRAHDLVAAAQLRDAPCPDPTNRGPTLATAPRLSPAMKIATKCFNSQMLQ